MAMEGEEEAGTWRRVGLQSGDEMGLSDFHGIWEMGAGRWMFRVAE